MGDIASEEEGGDNDVGEDDVDENVVLVIGGPIEVDKPCGIKFPSAFLTSNAAMSLGFLFFSAEFHLFLTAFGGLPLPNAFAISVHLFPNVAWYFTICSSSSLVHASLRTSGARWLKYLSLHCFPTRNGICLAMLDHFCAPYLFTKNSNISSSCLVQGPFLWDSSFFSMGPSLINSALILASLYPR